MYIFVKCKFSWITISVQHYSSNNYYLLLTCNWLTNHIHWRVIRTEGSDPPLSISFDDLIYLFQFPILEETNQRVWGFTFEKHFYVSEVL